MHPRILLPLVFLLAIWFPVLEILQLEWRLNEQYQYGYFVPFFTLYLLYLRWDDRPAAAPSSGRSCMPVLLLGTLLFVPLKLVHTANPDWRLIYWIATLLATSLTLLWIHQIGGRRWVRHFAPALAMILFAVPWITGVENQITSTLMEFVSAFTVEVLNLAGIFAVRSGNVIVLQGAVVGVEEACSGVRSFQSALMAGYLFGELLRFRMPTRLLLITLGAGVNFLLNLGRTLILTLISLNLGPELFEAWHDRVGNAVALGGFLTVALLAWLLRRIFKPQSPESEQQKSADASESSALRVLPASLYIALVGGVILAFAFNAFWYRQVQDSSRGFDYHSIQWESVSNPIESREMDPVAVAQLKFSEGTHRNWTDSSGIRWTAFYFHWDQGRISSHAGIHRPENCLPSAGISLAATHESMVWQSPEGYTIPFQTMTFKGMGTTTYVFFAVWDENGAEPWISTTWGERLSDVWKRRVVTGRHSLQFLAENATSLEQARRECLSTLDRMYGRSGQPTAN